MAPKVMKAKAISSLVNSSTIATNIIKDLVLEKPIANNNSKRATKVAKTKIAAKAREEAPSIADERSAVTVQAKTAVRKIVEAKSVATEATSKKGRVGKAKGKFVMKVAKSIAKLTRDADAKKVNSKTSKKHILIGETTMKPKNVAAKEKRGLSMKSPAKGKTLAGSARFAMKVAKTMLKSTQAKAKARAQAGKEKARMAKQKAKAQAARDKEKLVAAKEKEKASALKQQEKEKAQAEAAKAKAAAVALKQQEKEKALAAKAKALEKEKLAKEKAKVLAEKAAAKEAEKAAREEAKAEEKYQRDLKKYEEWKAQDDAETQDALAKIAKMEAENQKTQAAEHWGSDGDEAMQEKAAEENVGEAVEEEEEEEDEEDSEEIGEDAVEPQPSDKGENWISTASSQVF